MSFASLLPLTCTVQTSTPAPETSGQMVDSWANTLTGVKCRLEPLGAGLVRTPTEEFDKASHTLFMLIPSSAIVTKEMRIVLASLNYKILRVDTLYDTGTTHHLELILELLS